MNVGTTWRPGMSDRPGIAVRPMRDADLAFVNDGFLRSYGAGIHGCDCCDHAGGVLLPGPYFDATRPKWDKERNRSTVLLACSPTDDDALRGFVAFRGDLLLYVFVKKLFRGSGIGSHLLEAAGFRRGAPVRWAYPTVRGMLWANANGWIGVKA